MIFLTSIGKEKKYPLWGLPKYISQTIVYMETKLFDCGSEVPYLLILSKAKISQN